MSSVEDQLVRDIKAVTGGIVVTGSDLRNARVDLDERIESRKQERGRRTIVAAAAAVLVFTVGAVAFRTLDAERATVQPADSGPSTVDPYQDFLVGAAPTAAGLRGVWRLSNDALLRFSSPDQVSIDEHGRMFDNPDITGTYTIDGDQITVSVSGGRYGCDGQSLVMRASLPDQDELRMVTSESGTGKCAMSTGETWSLDRVAATGPFLTALDPYSSASNWKPLSADTNLVGSWFAEGGGYYLELGDDGTYYVADGSGTQIDQGQWSRDSSGLTLTSSSQSATCAAGDQLVLDNLKGITPGTLIMRSTVAANTCQAPWAGKGWILIPYPGS